MGARPVIRADQKNPEPVRLTKGPWRTNAEGLSVAAMIGGSPVNGLAALQLFLLTGCWGDRLRYPHLVAEISKFRLQRCLQLSTTMERMESSVAVAVGVGKGGCFRWLWAGVTMM